MMLLIPRSAQQVAFTKIGLFIFIGFLCIFIRASGVCDDVDDVEIHDRKCCLLRSAVPSEWHWLLYLFVFFVLINIIFINTYINYLLTAQCPARGIGSCFIPGFVGSPPVSGNPTTPLFQTYKNVE